MSSEVWIGILSGGGLATILVALINGWWQRRKLGADAAAVIQRAASGVVKDMELRLDRQEEDMGRQVEKHESTMRRLRREHTAAIRQLLHDHERELERRDRWLREHLDWDHAVIAEAHKHGIELPDPPPLPEWA